MRWVIGIVVVVVLVILGYQYFAPGEMEIAEQPEVADEAEMDVAEPAEEPAGEAEQAAEETAAAVEETTEEAAEVTEQAAEETMAAGEEAAEATEEATEEAMAAGEEAAQATEQAGEETMAATEEAAGEAQEATEEAMQTAALVVGDIDVGEQLTDAVQSTEEALQGITDAESAEAAVPALEAINTQLEELSGTVDQLPDDAKKVLADLLSERVTELKTLADDVTGQEGVGDVVTPALEPIIAKLEDWSQAPA